MTGTEITLWLQEAAQWIWDNFEWGFYIIGIIIIFRIISWILE